MNNQEMTVSDLLWLIAYYGSAAVVAYGVMQFLT